MTSEKRAQKFHADGVSLPRSRWGIISMEFLPSIPQTSFRKETSGGIPLSHGLDERPHLSEGLDPPLLKQLLLMSIHDDYLK